MVKCTSWLPHSHSRVLISSFAILLTLDPNLLVLSHHFINWLEILDELQRTILLGYNEQLTEAWNLWWLQPTHTNIFLKCSMSLLRSTRGTQMRFGSIVHKVQLRDLVSDKENANAFPWFSNTYLNLFSSSSKSKHPTNSNLNISLGSYVIYLLDFVDSNHSPFLTFGTNYC